MNYKHKGLLCIILINFLISGTIFQLSAQNQLFIITFFAYSDYSPLYSIITYSLIHNDGGHLVGNMLFLGIYGFFLEPIIGTKKFVILYVMASILTVLLFQQFVDLTVPCIGASGAVCAILGATFYINIPKPLFLMLAALIALEIVKSLMGVVDGVAHLAHVIGFIFGFFFMLFFYGKGISAV
jgi:membrane associated rhomboid family serine protease